MVCLNRFPLCEHASLCIYRNVGLGGIKGLEAAESVWQFLIKGKAKNKSCNDSTHVSQAALFSPTFRSLAERLCCTKEVLSSEAWCFRSKLRCSSSVERPCKAETNIGQWYLEIRVACGSGVFFFFHGFDLRMLFGGTKLNPFDSLTFSVQYVHLKQPE